MLFNSITFAIFLPIVFVLYWFVTQNNLKVQNIMLLLASYFFYAYWDYRFLLLLVFSTTLDFISGKMIGNAKTRTREKFWFWLSIIVNLTILGFFKYYNFFAVSFAQGVSGLGFHVNPTTFSLVLPVGISFYTFHELSYIIDIYKKRIKPVNDFVDYSLFVTFFPLLVAGPIERATHLLPQIQVKRQFSYEKAVDGLRQMLWGFFKKVVLADNCAEYANQIFNNSGHYSGSGHVVGAIFFAIQIYCDFSGYSDIALGTARLFGIELLRNFAYPYFSRDIAEFWRRWHISLSSWFRDYLYFPLGGSRGNLLMKIRNTFIIFLVSGFWHGANWTFIVWGGLNALYFLPLLILNRNRNNLETVAQGKLFPTLKELFSMIITFALTVFAWIFFRAENMTDAISFIKKIFSKSLLSAPGISAAGPITIIALLFFAIEWLGREQPFAIQKLFLETPRFFRWSFYLVLVVMIFMFDKEQQQFIYFHF